MDPQPVTDVPQAGHPQDDTEAKPVKQVSEQDAAVSSVRRPECIKSAENLTPDLAAVLDAWGNLPQALKDGILAMVRSAAKQK